MNEEEEAGKGGVPLDVIQEEEPEPGLKDDEGNEPNATANDIEPKPQPNVDAAQSPNSDQPPL